MNGRDTMGLVHILLEVGWDFLLSPPRWCLFSLQVVPVGMLALSATFRYLFSCEIVGCERHRSLLRLRSSVASVGHIFDDRPLRLKGEGQEGSVLKQSAY